MHNFEKIIRLGTTQLSGYQTRSHVFCRIKYQDHRLTISGVEGPDRHGNCRGSCGQIDKPEIKQLAPRWTQEMLDKFFDIWKQWHLNDLHAGCDHQRAMGWEKDGYDRHPCEPCPQCGYKFGTAWNHVEVPEFVLEFLYNLPNTDIEPNWV